MKKKCIVIVIGLFCGIQFLGVFGYAEDLLMKAFAPTIEQDLTIDVGSTKDSVGHSITKGRTTYKASISEGKFKFDKDKKESLLVNISKKLLQLTIVLSVTMIIYNAILYATKVLGGESYKSKESLKKIWMIGVGIALALGSLAIIDLIRSLSSTFLQK